MTTPIYMIIESDIKKRIYSGQLKSGDMIPSENDLKDVYGVSRMTVRQALNNLVNEGFLYRHKGKGTFVSSMKIEKSIHGVRSFTEEMESFGRKVSSKIINFSLIKADVEIAEKLFLEENEEVYHIERIRYADNMPVLFENLFIPYCLFKNITKDILKGSFYDYMEKELKLKISHSMQSIEAKAADSRVSQNLNIEKNAPVLFIIRNTFLNNGRPFEYVKSYYKADSYKFVQYAAKG